MKKERFDVLKKIIEKDRWKINADEGVVEGRHGSTGYVDSAGYKRTTGRYRRKTYVYGVHEVILAHAGCDLTDKEITFIDGDKSNARLDNLKIVNIGESSRYAKQQERIQWRRFTDDEVRAIRKGITDGQKVRDIAKQFDTTYKTIARIRQGLTYQEVE